MYFWPDSITLFGSFCCYLDHFSTFSRLVLYLSLHIEHLASFNAFLKISTGVLVACELWGSDCVALFSCFRITLTGFANMGTTYRSIGSIEIMNWIEKSPWMNGEMAFSSPIEWITERSALFHAEIEVELDGNGGVTVAGSILKKERKKERKK